MKIKVTTNNKEISKVGLERLSEFFTKNQELLKRILEKEKTKRG